MEWYLDKVSSSTGQGTNQWSKIFVEQLPIPIIEDERKEILETLVDIVIYCNQNKSMISNTIENKTLGSYFELIIDGIIFDMYFQTHLEDEGIAITDELKSVLNEVGLVSNFEYETDENKNKSILNLYNIVGKGIIQIKMADYITKSPEKLKLILQN